MSPSFSRASSLDRDVSLGPETSHRVLRVKRLVRTGCSYQTLQMRLSCQQIDGEWQTEIVRDPAVIRAYIRKRQAIEEENTTADALAPTGDEEKDERAKKRQVIFFIYSILC